MSDIAILQNEWNQIMTRKKEIERQIYKLKLAQLPKTLYTVWATPSIKDHPLREDCVRQRQGIFTSIEKAQEKMEKEYPVNPVYNYMSNCMWTFTVEVYEGKVQSLSEVDPECIDFDLEECC